MPDRRTVRSRVPFAGLVLAVAVGCGSSDRIPTGAVSGTITVNGKPVEGLIVRFIPTGKIRPAAGKTNSAGYYEAQLLAHQWGVPEGPCVVEFGLYKGDAPNNYLREFNEDAADDPRRNLEITGDGLVFDYDIKFDGKLPPSATK